MKTWSEVIQNPDYQSLSQQDKYQAQVQYFNDVVRPRVPKEKLGEARNQFFGQYQPEIYKSNPTERMSETEKFNAGMGKAFTDIGRGVRQLLPGDNPELQSEVDESKKLDAPLMNTGSGMAGNVTGNLSVALPSAFVPGANTILGSAMIGGGYGALQPITSEESKLHNIVTGSLAAGGTTAAVKGLGSVYRGVKGLIEPFTESGQERIAGRTLRRFASDPSTISNPAYTSHIPGVQPTLAESTLDPGISTLQRALGSSEPQIGSALAQRQMENNAARISAARNIAGDEGAMQNALKWRSASSEPLYEAAKKEVVTIDKPLGALLNRPSMQKAFEKAQQLASETGEQLISPETGKMSVNALHYMKMGLDDMLDNAGTSGIGAHERASLQSTKSALLDWLDKNSLNYGIARSAYAETSKPITQMEIGREILKRGASATEDALGNPTLYPANFNRAVGDSEKVVRAAGGLRGQELSNVMTPEQLATLQGIGKDLSVQQAAQNLARPVGSNTVQNLSSQNLMSQIGLPGILQKPLGAFRWLRPVDYTSQDSAIRQKLAEALLNPSKAENLIRASDPATSNALIEALKKYALPPMEMTAVPLINSSQ